jgi:hypothetical protein
VNWGAVMLKGIAKRYPLRPAFDRLDFQPVECCLKGITNRYPLRDASGHRQYGVAIGYPIQTTTGGRTS